MADVRIKKVDFIEGYARKFNDFGQAMLNNIHQCSQMTSQYEDRLHELQKRIEDSCARIEQNLKKASVEPIKKLLGQIKEKMPYPYPTEEEAYMSIVDAICQMGEKKHRDKVMLFYAARRLRDDGLTLAEVAKSLNVTSRKVGRTLYGGVQAYSTLIKRKL